MTVGTPWMDPLQLQELGPLEEETLATLSLVGSSIAETVSDDLAPDERSRQEEQILDFVDELEERELVLRAFHGWFEEASRRHPARDRIVRFLESRGALGDAPAAQTTAPEIVSPVEVVSRLESQGFVRRAPRFAEVRKDGSRANIFRYDGQSSFDTREDRGRALRQMTEHEGLQELGGFLDTFIARAGQPRAQVKDSRFKYLAEQAKSMRANLTFIGTPEFDEAAAGLASYWKAFLDGDPDRQICLPISASELWRYRSGNEGAVDKSDSLVKAEILKHLEGEGGQDYAGRIITSIEDISAAPANVKVIVVDDWMVSGRQVQSVCDKLLTNPVLRPYADSVEVDLLAAPRHFVEEGVWAGYVGGSQRVPVRAYYEAYSSARRREPDPNCHITGLHSSVNFGFADILELMVEVLNGQNGRGQAQRQLPALASVYRPYWAAKGSVPVLTEVAAVS